MGFYKLTEDKYKEVKKDFSNTYIGMKITVLFYSLLGVSALYTIFTLLEIVYYTLTDQKFTTNSLLVDFVLIITFFMSALIVYPFYISNLRKYYEENKVKTKISSATTTVKKTVAKKKSTK